MNDLDIFLDELWAPYTRRCPLAEPICELLEARGDEIVIDHLAFRTFAHPTVGIDRFAALLQPLGYEARGDYRFEAKKLDARHFECPGRPDAPRVFISELRLAECSPGLQQLVEGLLGQVDSGHVARRESLVGLRPWAPVSFATWQNLRRESEYAAWLAAFGFCANHFTLFVNALASVGSLLELVALLEAQGYSLNDTGGVIKGSPEIFLEQVSTLAPLVEVEFADGLHEIPGCYLEFARRYPLPDGTLFSGFVTDSADKIFESTHARQSR